MGRLPPQTVAGRREIVSVVTLMASVVFTVRLADMEAGEVGRVDNRRRRRTAVAGGRTGIYPLRDIVIAGRGGGDNNGNERCSGDDAERGEPGGWSVHDIEAWPQDARTAPGLAAELDPGGGGQRR